MPKTQISEGDADREFSLFGPWGSSAPNTITLEGDAVDLAIDNTGTTQHTFTGKARGANSSGNTIAILAGGQGVLLSGKGVASVSIDSADAGVIFRKGPRGTVRPFSPLISTGLSGNSEQLGPVSPAGQATGLQLGMGSTFKFTPTRTGVLLVILSGTAFGAVAAGIAAGSGSLRLDYGTGAAPAAGAAQTGTIIGPTAQISQTLTAADQETLDVPFCICVIIGGLTVGTQYWFDLFTFIGAGWTTMGVLATGATITEYPA